MSEDNWKNRASNMKCVTCMWWVSKAGTALGRCRRRAPTLGGWPAVVEAMTRPLSEIACCAHLRVSYAPIHNDDGTVSPRWLCNLCDSRFAPASNPESACEPVEGDGAGAADPWTGDQRRAAFSVCESVQRWGRCEVPLSEVCETLARVAPLFVEVERPKCGDARANAAWIEAIARLGVRVKEPA